LIKRIVFRKIFKSKLNPDMSMTNDSWWKELPKEIIGIVSPSKDI
jgi:hypothetical protein